MDALRFLKAKNKMTDCCRISCNDFQFSCYNNSDKTSCFEFIVASPEEAVKIVEHWIERYEVSYRDDFLKKFPDASKDANGNPEFCRKHIYGGECPPHEDCNKCWLEVKYVEGYDS